MPPRSWTAFLGSGRFTDPAVSRPDAQQLLRRVQFVPQGAGEGLLDGDCEIAVRLLEGAVLTAALELPEGAPGRPPSIQTLAQKALSCLDGLDLDVEKIDWESAVWILAAHTPS